MSKKIHLSQLHIQENKLILIQMNFIIKLQNQIYLSNIYELENKYNSLLKLFIKNEKKSKEQNEELK